MPVIVTFSARVQRRHLENSYLGLVVVVVGPSDRGGRGEKRCFSDLYSYSTTMIICIYFPKCEYLCCPYIWWWQ